MTTEGGTNKMIVNPRLPGDDSFGSACKLGSVRTQLGDHMRSLSIVIPAYNEEARIGPSLESLMQYLARQGLETLEVIVVDDGSTDHTTQYVERFASIQPDVRVLRNTTNKGKGYSVRRGVLAAKGQWILCTDADMSTPVDEVVRLLRTAIEEDAPIVIGSRAVNRSLVGKRQSKFRELSGRLFNRVMRAVTGLPFMDTQCGFKLFRADAARQVFARQKLAGFCFDVENLFVANLLQLRTVEAAVRWNNAEGSKVNGIGGLRSFGDLFMIRWHHRVKK